MEGVAFPSFITLWIIDAPPLKAAFDYVKAFTAGERGGGRLPLLLPGLNLAMSSLIQVAQYLFFGIAVLFFRIWD